MRRPLGTFALWLVLLFVADQLFTWVYNSIYFPIVDPATYSVHYGDTIPDLILLTTNILIFSGAGAIVAWRMQGAPLSVAVGIALGCVWLAAEIATRIPWFQLMPAHPTNYDRVMAFIGALSAPMAGAFGAYLYSWVRVRRSRRHAT